MIALMTDVPIMLAHGYKPNDDVGMGVLGDVWSYSLIHDAWQSNDNTQK